ncbi:MAG: spermidine synthase [Oligoflexus sp.]
MYKNKVLHSEYNHRHIFTGSIWDLLAIPAWFIPPEKQKRALILGLGGGASCLILDRLFHFKQLVTVEIEALHIDVTKKFFQLNDKKFVFVNEDGLHWVERYRGPRFDYIVEDMFVEDAGEPKRAFAANLEWMQQLRGLLSPSGVLVMNFADEKELRESCYTRKSFQKNWKTIFRLKPSNAENVVAIFSQQALTSGDLRRRIAELKGQYPGQRKWPSYTIKKIKT